MLDLTNFKNIVSDLVYYLDDINGNRLYRKLKNDDIKEVEQDQEKMGAFLALEFLVIPFLSTKEITSLLKYNLSAGLMIDDIDITERIAKGLIDLNLGDRDNCKKELKNALVSSQEKLTDKQYAKAFSDWQKAHDDVVAAGGLYVIGTERHESRRIDNQLRGRSGRQGDPGASKFYLALDDEIMRIFGGDQVAKIMGFLKIPENEPIEHSMVSKAIEQAQVKVEGFNFDARKSVVEYDDVMNKQREIIYNLLHLCPQGHR